MCTAPCALKFFFLAVAPPSTCATGVRSPWPSCGFPLSSGHAMSYLHGVPRALCRPMYRARALLHTVATSYHNILDNVEAVSVDNSYLTLAYLSEEVDNRERQRAVMHLQNQGLIDAQLDKLLSSCRRLREVLSQTGWVSSQS